jgi:hypothetical protein
MYWDRDEQTLYLLHSSLQLRVPVRFDRGQFLLWIGVTCPRHRRLLKARLGWFGRFVPYRVWTIDEHENEILVSTRRRPWS